MQVLVTGATGRVGGSVLKALLAEGASVRALSREPATALVPSGVEAAAGDLNGPDTMDGALAGMHAVFL
jgi:uncharacterized protein YbjT (DUF2867 family)